MGVITLLTDFGLQDEYVGVVKGVILNINPQISIVDISHQVSPQDTLQAGEMLLAAYRWFPKNTVHVAVVDPGVGSDRAIIVSKHSDCLFLAPDNGLLTAVWAHDPPESIVRVEDEAFYLKPASLTFHGRDIFAPVAAHLSMGVEIERLGTEIGFSDIVQLPLRHAEAGPDGVITGRIVSIDRFGNLITNITSGALDPLIRKNSAEKLKICVAEQCIDGLSTTYAHGNNYQLMALVGSRDRLEIAVNGGRAADFFTSAMGLNVKVSA